MQLNVVNVNNKLMNRWAYFTDILARSFFIFVVGYLWLRKLWLAILISFVINVFYESIWGKKYWQKLKQTPHQPRRSLRTILQIFWQRLCDRRRTKGLVWTGIIVLIMSFVVKLQTFYLICAGVIFSLAAVSRFAPVQKTVIIPHEPESDQTCRETDCQPPTAK